LEGNASRCSRWPSGAELIITSCSSSRPRRPGTTAGCANVWRAGPNSFWTRGRWCSMTPGFPRMVSTHRGVARMYRGALGKTGNCQVGVSLHAATDWASAAVNWRLFLPASWAMSTPLTRRKRSRPAAPGQGQDRPRSAVSGEVAPGLGHARRDHRRLGVGLATRPVVADIGYGRITGFRRGLADRDLGDVLAVRSSTSAHPGEAVVQTPTWSPNRSPAQVRLSRQAHQPTCSRYDCRPHCSAAGHLAPRHEKDRQQPHRCGALAFPDAAGSPGQPQQLCRTC
jgi:SRSO17 transposase